MSDGQVVFEISADGRQAMASIDDITRALQRSGRQWENNAREATDNIGNSFGSLVKKIAAGFSLAAVGKKLLDFGKQAVEAASDLAEVQNVVDTTFEDSSGTVDRWAKNAINQFGLTETKAKQFASTLGAMMKSAGLSGDSIVQVSTDLAGLAADMSSFYNLDFDTAFQKIRAGISGETEPLKQLGINMSVANLEAFALQQGLGKTFSEMSQGEQIMLRYQYIMQATSDAQGDFAKTSDGFANGLRLLESNLNSFVTNVGSVLIPFVNDVIGGINSLFEDRKGERTVLDDFADIDEDTAKRLEQIETTAQTARELNGLMAEIKSQTSSAMQGLLDSTGNITPISDQTVTNAKELAGGLERIEKVDIKASKQQIAEISDTKVKNYNGVSTSLESIKKSVKEIEGANLNENSGAVKAIAKMEGSAGNIKQLGEGLIAVKQNIDDLDVNQLATTSSDIADAIEPATEEMQNVSGASDEWLGLCERLVKVLPGLSTIINTQTGEIKGGSEAVENYIDQWQEAQTLMARVDAVQRKHAALEKKRSELDDYWVEMVVSQNTQRKARESLIKAYAAQGYDIADIIERMENGDANATVEFGALEIDANKYGTQKLIDDYENAKEAADAATKSYNLQNDAFIEAEEAVNNADEAMQEEIDTQKQAILLNEAQAEAVQGLTDRLNSAKAAMEDYRKNAVEKTIQSLDKLAGTFESIELDEDSAKTAKGMLAGLNTQIKYLDQYKTNLELAEQKGLSKELLAQLADGSKESAEYLAALADSSTTREDIERINEAYKGVTEQKAQLAEELADKQLAVDDSYAQLKETVNQAEKDLKQAQDLMVQNTGDSVEGIARQIESHLPEVQSAVKQLNDILSGAGMKTIYIPGLTNTSGESVVPGFAEGLDTVPYDNFLARLHAGESVLTAEEAKVWRGLTRGGVDYDQLGGVMRDNIQPGGNVYLDGRVVGAVISQMQGNQYRSLQRSGWQS